MTSCERFQAKAFKWRLLHRRIYWGLRDYGVGGQLGLESTPDEYVANMVDVFREVRRVLRPGGTLWLNIGDSYNGYMANQRGTGLEANRQQSRKYIESGAGLRTSALKNKDLVGIPWMLAFALRADGWYLRQEIIWHKPNPMPESVTDRCTKAHESLFLLAKSPRYYYDAKAIAEKGSGWNDSRFEDGKNAEVHPNVGRKRRSVRPGIDTHGGSQGSGYMEFPTDTRNKRSVWSIPTAPFPEAHFATFPPALVEPCVLAGSKPGDLVLDPFIGSGTTAMVARNLGRRAVGIDLNPEYLAMAERRIGGQLSMEAC